MHFRKTFGTLDNSSQILLYLCIYSQHRLRFDWKEFLNIFISFSFQYIKERLSWILKIHILVSLWKETVLYLSHYSVTSSISKSTFILIYRSYFFLTKSSSYCWVSSNKITFLVFFFETSKLFASYQHKFCHKNRDQKILFFTLFC